MTAAPSLLPDRIKQAREGAEMSREALAEAIGKSYKSIQNYETGATTPGSNTLARIAEVTGVEPTALFYGNTLPSGGVDPVRSGYSTAEEWAARNGHTLPDDGDARESFGPPGTVFVLVYRNDDGEPIYGFDHTGKVHQLGPPISVTVGLSSSSSGGSKS